MSDSTNRRPVAIALALLASILVLFGSSIWFISWLVRHLK